MNVHNYNASAWIRRYHPSSDAAVRLVCLPHAGGSATYYFSLSQALSPHLEVLAVQYPGRQDRRTEPCIEDIPALVDHIVAQLGCWLDRPIALFGHSMGATLAFEVARRLEKDGIFPKTLFVSARAAPSRHRIYGMDVSDDSALVEYLKKMSGTDARVFIDDDVLQMVLPTLRSDLKAAGSYVFEGGDPLQAPIFAHVGDRDPNATLDEVAAWSMHTASTFKMTVYPGGHFYLNEHVASVTEAILASMDRAS